MRRIILTEYVTLDGVMQDPHEWHASYWSDAMAAYKLRETMESGALLLGRVTWEAFAAAWPGRADEQGFADRFNTMPKYVVSTTLEDAGAWHNSQVLRGLAEVARLRDGDGQDIVVHGSADLARSLMEANLIDEYRIMVFPLVLGTGKRLFEERRFTNFLILTAIESLPNGVAVLTYAPAEDAVPSLEELDADLAIAV